MSILRSVAVTVIASIIINEVYGNKTVSNAVKRKIKSFKKEK